MTLVINLDAVKSFPSSCVVLLCGGCQAASHAIFLNSLGVKAYASETRFAPNVPLPPGWKAITDGPDCGFLCPTCVRESAEIISQMRNRNYGRKI